MKYLFSAFLFALFLSGTPAVANEVTQCFEYAWAHQDNGGLGLIRGQAIALCNGATDAIEVAQCYVLAWAHPDNGGLGLTAGQAVELCRTSAVK